MNLIAHSHLVITTKDVALITDYWSELLEIEPHFQNKGFSEFVLPSGLRFAFFLPTGKSGQHFSSESDRSQCRVLEEHNKSIINSNQFALV